MSAVYQTQQFEQDTLETGQGKAALEIEQLIEEIGGRYIADLQALSEEFSRFYGAQLALKDDQIAKLQQRLETAERERDTNAAQMRELKRASARYVADLRALSDQLSQHVDLSETADQAVEVGRGSP